MHLGSQVRDCVGHVGRAFQRRRVDTFLADRHLAECGIGKHGFADDPVEIGDRQPVGSDGGLDPIETKRPVVTAACIVLARPHHLDRAIKALSHVGGFHRKVRGPAGTTAETAAEEHGVDGDVGGGDTKCSGYELCVLRLTLCAEPHFAAIVFNPSHGVERLHARVCEVGQFVFDVNFAACLIERSDRITLILGE